MEIRVIKTKNEYEKALKYLSELMDENLASGSKEERILELLTLVIQDYEQKTADRIVVDPIEAIKFRMDQMEFSKKDLVPILGSLSRVSEVLSRKRGLSLSMIRKLHEELGIPLESLVAKPTTHRKTIRKGKFPKRRPPMSFGRQHKSRV